jgi:hypothetical protein
MPHHKYVEPYSSVYNICARYRKKRYLQMYCNRTLLKPSGKMPNVLFRKPSEKAAKTSLASHKSCEEMRGTDRLTASGRFSTPMFVFLWKKNQQCSFHPRLICQRSFHAIGIGNESWGRKQTRRLCSEQKKSKKRHCHEFFSSCISSFLEHNHHLEPPYLIYWF